MLSKIVTNEQQIKLSTSLGHVYTKLWTPQNPISKTPIVLLHDSLGSVAQWRDFPGQISQQLSCPVIAYDRLGFGQSSERKALPSNRFIEEEAEAYFPQIKQALSLEKYYVLGHSVGGAMAVCIAAKDKDCQGLITIAAQAFVEEKTLEGIRQAKQIFKDANQIEKLEKWHGSKSQWVLDAWIKRWLSDDFRDWSLKEVLHQVTCPVLAIHGDKDEYGSNAFPEIIASKTQGPQEKAILKDCGHLPHKEKTSEVMSLLVTYIDSNR
ncbi:MAG: alpha/beta hydrolase [Pseudomonadota bacterium]